MISDRAVAQAGLEVALVEGDEAWESFVADAPQGTYCHSSRWRTVVGDVLGHECLFYVARAADGAWLGALPLVRVRSRLFGHYLVSMPFLNRGGPLGSSEGQAAVVASAVAEARRSGADLLELRAREPVPADLSTSPRKITVTLDLPAEEDLLWRSFPSKLRTIIKRSTRDGLAIRYGAGEVDAFYEVFARNMRDLGTPVLPRRFFEAIASAFADTVIFAAVYLGDRPIAGQCAFVWRDELEMVWGSSLREYNQYKPTSLVHWEFMRLAMQRGLSRFDFGRCSPGSGTHQFKQRWGGVDVPLPWGQWSSAGVASTPSPDRPIFQLATRVWQRLPLSVASSVGPRIARQLP